MKKCKCLILGIIILFSLFNFLRFIDLNEANVHRKPVLYVFVEEIHSNYFRARVTDQTFTEVTDKYLNITLICEISCSDFKVNDGLDVYFDGNVHTDQIIQVSKVFSIRVSGLPYYI